MTKTSVNKYIHHKNWTNNNIFPGLLYLDTNIAIDIFEGNKHGIMSEKFLVELLNRGSMITWSSHTIDEITDFIHADHYVSEANKLEKSKPKWKTLEDRASNKKSITIANKVTNQVNQVISYLEQFGIQTEVDNNSADGLSKKVYVNYGGNRKDSLHVAISNLTGTNNILTNDSGFSRYPVNVFGTTNTIKQKHSSTESLKPFINLNKQLSNDNSEDIV